MNYKRIEDVNILRRFSKNFEEDYYLLRKDATSEDGKGELYFLLKVVGTIHIDEKLASELGVKCDKE